MGRMGERREGGSGTDRCLGEKRKEQRKKRETHPKRRGALKMRGSDGVWVECPYMFQLCIIVGSYIGYFIRVL